jgi:hypothetical protein
VISNSSSNGSLIALVRDLMFSGRIGAEARAAGLPCKFVRDPAQLPTIGTAADLLLVDLALPNTVEAATAWRAATGGTVIAFAPHVDTETIKQAQTAGFDQVMPRGRFVQILPDILRKRNPNQT